MRPIEFRGKIISYEEWIYGYLIKDGNSCCIAQEGMVYMPPSSTPGRPVHPESIGQFTGLPDETGAKIFEKDIVECEYGIGQIIYNDRNASFMIQWAAEDVQMEFINQDPRRNIRPVKVIGNMIDNPELLK